MFECTGDQFLTQLGDRLPPGVGQGLQPSVEFPGEFQFEPLRGFPGEYQGHRHRCALRGVGRGHQYLFQGACPGLQTQAAEIGRYAIHHLAGKLPQEFLKSCLLAVVLYLDRYLAQCVGLEQEVRSGVRNGFYTLAHDHPFGLSPQRCQVIHRSIHSQAPENTGGDRPADILFQIR